MHEHDGGRQERAVRGERWIDQEPQAFVDEDTDGRVGVHGEAALARGVVWLVQGHYGMVRVATVVRLVCNIPLNSTRKSQPTL